MRFGRHLLDSSSRFAGTARRIEIHRTIPLTVDSFKKANRKRRSNINKTVGNWKTSLRKFRTIKTVNESTLSDMSEEVNEIDSAVKISQLCEFSQKIDLNLATPLRTYIEELLLTCVRDYSTWCTNPCAHHAETHTRMDTMGNSQLGSFLCQTRVVVKSRTCKWHSDKPRNIADSATRHTRFQRK